MLRSPAVTDQQSAIQITAATSTHTRLSRDLQIAQDRFHTHLRRSVSASTYNLWLRPVRPIALTDTQLIATAPSRTIAWLTSRYRTLLEDAASAAAERPLSLDLKADPSMTPSATLDQSNRSTPAAAVRSFSRADRPPPQAVPTQPNRVNPLHTFSTYVIGPSNHLAHAAALAVAESPSHTYNPLIICGAPGLGKTHLLHAIAHFFQAHNPALTVIYNTADHFTSAFVSGIKTGTIDAVQTHNRGADVFLVDDVQKLQGKQQTEKELLRTLDHLIQLDKQVVLSIDRPPHDCEGLADRLKLLLQSGLRADLDLPDLQTRLTILHKQVSQDCVTIDDPAALPFLAQSLTTDPRTLLAALVRVIAFSSLTRRPITADLVAEVTSSLYPHFHRSPAPTLGRLTDVTARTFDLDPADLRGPTRTAHIVRSRHIAMYLARQLTDFSLPTIGNYFGGRDHTTVLHASRKIARQLNIDSVLKQSVHNLVLQLQPPA